METEKITVRLPIHMIQAIDTFIGAGEFASRSEAIRRAVNLLIDDLAEKMQERMETMRRIQEIEAMNQKMKELRRE